MGATHPLTLRAYWESCANCGIEFGVTAAFNRRLRETHAEFYCPHGHPQSYPHATEVDRLRQQLERERDTRRAFERQSRTAQAAATRAKNQLTKLERRVGRGVCPHCNRTFKQLAAHMKSKHPEATS